jgi:hypothetical protein
MTGPVIGVTLAIRIDLLAAAQGGRTPGWKRLPAYLLIPVADGADVTVGMCELNVDAPIVSNRPYPWEMKTRVNPPHPQAGPIGFAVLCAFGIVVAVRGMLQVRIGTEPWWVSVLLMVMVVAGFVFIDGGWVWVQRELTFSDGTIVVRRWFEVLRGRPGRVIPVDPRTRAAIVPRNGRSLRIERDGRVEALLTIGYWERKRIRELVDALRAHAIELDQSWGGDYPPGI